MSTAAREKFLDDLADRAAPVFAANDWRWGGVGSVDGLGEVPGVHEIRRTLDGLWQRLGDDDGSTLETGRLRLERETFDDEPDSFIVTAYLNLGTFYSDDEA